MKAFTKADLLNALKDLPDDTVIVLSSDEEGNDYGVLFQVEPNPEHNAVVLYPASGTVELADGEGFDFDDDDIEGTPV